MYKLLFGGLFSDTAPRSETAPAAPVVRMEVDSWQQAHGHRGDAEWALPRLVAACAEANRADQGNSTRADEFLDEPDVLDAKIELIAHLIKQSKYCIAYTGAGLSKSSGIPDYASKAKHSIVATPKIASSLDAQPTYAHHVLAALERRGYLKYYVQQNHDGLPQKAGFPQEKLNEIHGAWFDPSNPVVQFDESLRGDLFQEMLVVEKRADLCLCLGTSLSGMNADRCANTPAKRSLRHPDRVLGTVIINIQRTPLDERSAVRVWATLDRAFELLAEKLDMTQDEIVQRVSPPDWGTSDVFELPYTASGAKSQEEGTYTTLDLREGSMVCIAESQAMNAGAVGVVRGKRDGHWSIELTEKRRGKVVVVRRLLGWWWIEAAMRGVIPHLPVVNYRPRDGKSRDEQLGTYDE